MKVRVNTQLGGLSTMENLELEERETITMEGKGRDEVRGENGHGNLQTFLWKVLHLSLAVNQQTVTTPWDDRHFNHMTIINY